MRRRRGAARSVTTGRAERSSSGQREPVGRQIRGEALTELALGGHANLPEHALEVVAHGVRADEGEGGLVVDLINFPEDCGFHGWEPETLWAGEATSVEPESLRLVAEWSFESPNACGKCAHNFSFEVTPAPRADSLPVEIATRGCTEDVCGWTEYSIILPLGSTASGIRCAYGETRNLDAPPSDGSLHLPPVDGGSCAADLETFAHEAGRDICVATCSGDAECPLAGQLSCQQGLCVLADPWE